MPGPTASNFVTYPLHGSAFRVWVRITLKLGLELVKVRVRVSLDWLGFSLVLELELL